MSKEAEMAREIKFRVWTGAKMEHNVMAGFLGAFYVQGIDPKDAASMSPFNTIYSKETPVMQYTGLKDKNGVEIYEGDIVKAWEEVNGTYDDRILTVEFGYAQFSGNLANFKHYPVNGGWEVIGNIWENPELLREAA